MNNSTNPLSKTCSNCGEEILFGRSDKKFCTDACRVDHNNKAKVLARGQSSVLVKNISKILLSNYQILCKLNTRGKTVVSQRQLTEKGFNFQYLTSYHTTKQGRVYHYCFDQGYLSIEDGQVLLVVRDSPD